MNTDKAIQQRYACRKYRKEQITPEQLKILVDAANAAPVGMGDYTGYELIVVQDGSTRSAIDAGTAHAMPVMGEHPTYEAPTLMFICVKPNPQFPVIPYCGASCIAENIMVQATALGLASVFIMSVTTVMQEKPELLELLHLSQGFVPVVLVAVGYEAVAAAGKKDTRLAMRMI